MKASGFYAKTYLKGKKKKKREDDFEISEHIPNIFNFFGGREEEKRGVLYLIVCPGKVYLC